MFDVVEGGAIELLDHVGGDVEDAADFFDGELHLFDELRVAEGHGDGVEFHVSAFEDGDAVAVGGGGEGFGPAGADFFGLGVVFEGGGGGDDATDGAAIGGGGLAVFCQCGGGEGGEAAMLNRVDAFEAVAGEGFEVGDVWGGELAGGDFVGVGGDVVDEAAGVGEFGEDGGFWDGEEFAGEAVDPEHAGVLVAFEDGLVGDGFAELRPCHGGVGGLGEELGDGVVGDFFAVVAIGPVEVEGHGGDA